MSRYTFGGTIRDTVARRVRLIGHNLDDYGAATLTAWTAETGGTQITDLLVNGSPSTTIPVGTDGQIPEFRGPDGVTLMWLSAGGDRIKLLTSEGQVGDASTASLVADNTSATSAELEAGFARVITPEKHGAVGDYNPGTGAGTDDTAAIQAALDEAVATGAAVHFSAKHYKITSGLTANGAPGLHITGPRAGLIGAISGAIGAWLHWAGGAGGTMLTVRGSSNVVVDGLGFNGNNNATGVLIDSDNTPTSTNQTWRNLYLFRATTGIYINDSGASTQSDQILFESVRMEEIVSICFRTNSDNATGLRFLRCTTSIASSNDNTVHYQFDRGTEMTLESCFGGYGQDFVRLTAIVLGVALDSCQWEQSANADPAFVRLGNTADTGTTDVTTMRNCVVDGPVIVAGTSRRMLSQGNVWHSGGTIKLTGANTTFTSLCEAPPTPTVTGANAIMRQLDSALVTGGATPTPVAGANGSTAMSVVGNTYSGTVSFTTAAGLAADTYAVVVAPNTSIGAGYTVQLTPGNAAAAAALAYVDGMTAFQWSLNLHNPPAGATAMVFHYRVS